MEIARPVSRRRREDRFSPMPADLSPSTRTPFTARQREGMVSSAGLGTRGGTGGPRPGRTVMDASYFHSLLVAASNRLANEIRAIVSRTEREMRDQAAYHIYDKRVKSMVRQLTEAQGILMDYNLTMERLHSEASVNLARIAAETKKLKVENDSELVALEELYNERTRRHEAATHLENQIKKENDHVVEIIRKMNDSLSEAFMKLKSKNEELVKEKDNWQRQLDSLHNMKGALTDQIMVSPMKGEALRLELRIEELMQRKKSLEGQREGAITKDQYMDTLKANNHHITIMEKSIAEINNKIVLSQDILSKSSQLKDEMVGTRQSKYLELKRREESMEEFMSRAESQRDEESDKLRGLENEIAALLRTLSVRAAALPTAEDFKYLADMNPPSAPLNTSSSLITQYKETLAYQNKVQIISKQMTQEIESLRNMSNEMDRDLEILSDVDKLKRNMEESKEELTVEYEELKAKHSNTLSTIMEANKALKKVQKSLVENETNGQLVYLERKLASVEQSNFTIMDYMSSLVHHEEMALYSQLIMKLINYLNGVIINNVKPSDL